MWIPLLSGAMHIMKTQTSKTKQKKPCLSFEATTSTTLGPVVQSVISLTSSLRVISLTVLADSMYNILIFFAEKM